MRKSIGHHKVLAVPIAVLFLCGACRQQPDAHVGQIKNHLIQTREQVLTTLPPEDRNRARFITFWDFDGTIIKGDCTEGLVIDGRQAFNGLAQKAIEAGFSRNYPPESYELFKKTVLRLEKDDHEKYLLLYPRAIAGNDEKKIIAFSENYFNTTLRDYLFRSSMDIIEALKKEGIDIYIISASAHVFVLGSAPVLHIPRDNIRGIVMKSKGGIISSDVIPPVTYGPGKTLVMQDIIAGLKRKSGAPVFVLAGFGNSYATDGHFLSHIAGLKLPAGSTLSVMINGGKTPEEYRGRFLEVTQERIMK